VLIDGDVTQDDLELAARICARFGQGKEADQVEVQINELDGSSQTLKVEPIHPNDFPKEWYV
jgi:hypothetical protein